MMVVEPAAAVGGMAVRVAAVVPGEAPEERVPVPEVSVRAAAAATRSHTGRGSPATARSVPGAGRPWPGRRDTAAGFMKKEFSDEYLS